MTQIYSKLDLMTNGNAMLTLPKVAVLRSFVMNHLIHHRAPTRRTPAIERLLGAVNLHPSPDESPSSAW
jgi:hypothetical protein